jgi:Domain of unknown function (DUF4232)
MDGLRRTGWLWIAAGLGMATLMGCGPTTGGGGTAAPTTTASAAPSETAPSQTGPTQTGSTQTGSSQTSATTATATTPAGPDRCHTADLAARVRQLDSAAGQRYAALTLTNRSTRTCRIYGYGGVQLLDAARRPVPTTQVRDRTAAPHLVTLAPGASAFSRLHWGVVVSTGDRQTGTCEPTPAYLQVIPPDETQPIIVGWTFGPVCQRGRIEQTAYALGSGPAA